MVGSITDALADAIPASALRPPAGKLVDDTAKKDASISPDSAVKQNAEDQTRTEDAIKDRDAAAKERPAFPVLDQEPKPDPVDPSQGYVAAIGVLGAIGSMFTRSPMTESMNAAAAALNSAKQMDAENFKKKSDIWKIKNDNALKLFDYQNNTYKDIMASKNKSVDERIAELRANAVAFKDENMMKILEDRNPAVIEDLLAKSSDALASAQKKSAEMEKFANQNYATMQTMAVAKEDLDARRITKEQYAQKLQEAANASAKAVQATKVTLSDASIAQKAKAIAKDGATYASVGLSTRGNGNPDKDAVDNYISEHYPDADLSKAQIDFAANKAGATAAARTVATKGATIELSSNLLNNSLPILEDSFAKVDNTKFKDINSFENYYKDHSNDPDLAALHEAILNTESDLALLMRRGGASTVDSANRAEKIINDAMNSKSFEGVKNQILREAKASNEAVQQTKDEQGGKKSRAKEDLPPKDGRVAGETKWTNPQGHEMTWDGQGWVP